MRPVQLYNTRTRAKETYTQFDFLVRLLRARGFAVTYVQNITDVDDKIISRACELGIDPPDLARSSQTFLRLSRSTPTQTPGCSISTSTG